MRSIFLRGKLRPISFIPVLLLLIGIIMFVASLQTIINISVDSRLDYLEYQDSIKPVTMPLIAPYGIITREMVLEYQNERKAVENLLYYKHDNQVEISRGTRQYKSLGIFKISHYCPCEICCGKTDGITSSGTNATANRTIAVDTDIIALGSAVVIQGKQYIAEDIGGGINVKEIDIFVDSHQYAKELGVIYKEVFIKLQP